MGLTLALSFALAVVVPVWLVRSLVRESAHQAVEGEVVRLGLGILDATRLGLDEHLGLLHQAVDAAHLSPDGRAFHLPFRPVPLGPSYLIRTQGPAPRIYNLVPPTGGDHSPGGTDFRLEETALTFQAGTQTLAVLQENPDRRLWIGQLPFLPQAASGLWLVEFLPGSGGTDLAAFSLAPGYLRDWLARLSKSVAADVYLVTADNLVLPQQSPDLFGQTWASKALSRSKEGVFFTFPTPEVLVHVYADPEYLFNLLAVMPRGALTATVDGVIDQTTIFTALVAVVLGLVSLSLLWIFARQLRRLTRQLSGIAEGNFRTLPEGMGAFLTETDRIAQGINTLAARLEENRRTIDEAQRTLEARVADRTASLSRTLEKLKAAQDTLVQTEKMAALGRTVAAFTHEINNPLGAALTVIGLVEETVAGLRGDLKAGPPVPPDLGTRLDTLAEATEMVHRSLQRAIDVTGSVKTVAADQTRAEVRVYDLAEYLAEVASALTPMLRHQIHSLNLQAEPGIRLRGDPAVLYQIVSNLVINSVKHGFEGRPRGRITIEARRAGDEVVLEYRDDGNGMGPEQLSRLYEPFYTTKRGAGGTGLGMSIVYNLVHHDLGGQVVCESRPGEGVRFTIRFPAPPLEALR
jgi:signal transduction histidine kinase